MKRIILLISLSLFTSNLFAQASEVSVFSENGEKFWVVIDGIKQNTKPQTNVKVTGLDKLNYLVKVIFEDDKISSVSKDIMTRDVNGAATTCSYVLRKNKKGEMLMKLNNYQPLDETKPTEKSGEQSVVNYRTEGNSENDVSMNVPGMGVDMSVSEDGEDEEADKTRKQKPKENGSKNPKSQNQKQGGVGINVNFNDPVNNEKVGINLNVNIPDDGIGKSDASDNNDAIESEPKRKNPGASKKQPYVPAAPEKKSGTKACVNPVSIADFTNIKSSLGKQTFEDTRLKMMKDIMKRNCFSSSQIKELMEQFTFEKNKLEVAKYAYDFCTDKDNYYQLNDGFTFSSSVDELSSYLEGK